MKIQIITVAIIGGLTFMTSCKKEDPIIPNEEELITTVIYQLISPFNDTTILSFQDLDGSGGNLPIITTGSLSPNTTYAGSLQVLNEQENPPKDITLEVLNEAEDHQFFYLSTNGLQATVDYMDSDANGNPIGVNTELTTNTNSSGQLTIVLRHKPDKFASGVSQGDISNAGGGTDIEVVFDVDIQ